MVDPATEQLTVTIDAPSAGKVAVVANATAKSAPNNGRLVCQITDDRHATTIDARKQVVGIASPATGGSQPSLGTNRVFDVAGRYRTRSTSCARRRTVAPSIHYRSMAATFTANG